MIPVLYLIALIALIIASYTDIKTREVPDWLNFSLILVNLVISYAPPTFSSQSILCFWVMHSEQRCNALFISSVMNETDYQPLH